MITIRPETPADGPAIDALYLRAFGPGRFAKTAERLREGNCIIEALSLVALDGEKLIGAVRISEVVAETGGSLLFLGPIAVEIEWRHEGIGQELTRHAMELARADGWEAVCLVGTIGFFGPVGFVVVPQGQITLPGPVDPARLLYADLVPGAFEKIAGAISVPRAATPAPAGQVPAACPASPAGSVATATP